MYHRLFIPLEKNSTYYNNPLILKHPFKKHTYRLKNITNDVSLIWLFLSDYFEGKRNKVSDWNLFLKDFKHCLLFQNMLN